MGAVFGKVLSIAQRTTIACLVYTGVAHGGVGPASSNSGTARVAVPAAAEQKAVEDKLRQLFPKEYASRSPEALSGLSAKLFKMATQSGAEDASAYVLLRDARDVAAAAGDLDAALQASDALSDRYDIRPASSASDAIVVLARHVPAGERAGRVVNEALSISEGAVAANDFADASRLIAAAGVAAGRSNVASHPKDVDSAARECQSIQGEYDRVVVATKQLLSDPQNRHAAALVGEYLCCVNADWSRGLPLLAHGSPEPLTNAAQADLNATQSDEVIKVADQWYALAQKEHGRIRSQHLFQRAALRYSEASKTATGLQKIWVEQRLSEIENRAVQRQGTVSGFLSAQHELEVSCVMADWAHHAVKVNGLPYAHSLFLHPPPDGSAHVTYNVGAGAAWFDARVALTDDVGKIPTPLTFQLVGDGDVLWESQPVQQSRQVQTCRVSIARVRRLTLVVKCPGRNLYAHAVWIEPRVIAG